MDGVAVEQHREILEVDGELEHVVELAALAQLADRREIVTPHRGAQVLQRVAIPVRHYAAL